MPEVQKLIKILNERAAEGPGDKLSKTDSLNVALGMTDAFKNVLKSKLDAMSNEDKLNDDPEQGAMMQHANAMELKQAILDAKKGNKGIGDIAFKSEGARKMFESLIQPKANEMIAGGTHQKFLQIGQGINPLDIYK